MPAIPVVFYQESEGSSEVVTWLFNLRAANPRAYAKCVARIERLAREGHELRRPEADMLRNGIYELRASLNGVHYRLLYFFHGRAAAVIACGFTKEAGIPEVEINRAIKKRDAYVEQPRIHTFVEVEA